MAIQKARQGNAQQDPCSHNQCEHDGTKVFDGVKYKELSNGRANRKQQEVGMNLGMPVHKLQCRIQLLGMNQGDPRQYGGKGRCSKHQLDHGQVPMSLKHAALKLTGETVKQ